MREITKTLKNKVSNEATDLKLRASNAVLLAGVGLGPLASINVFAEEKDQSKNIVTDVLGTIVGLFPLIGIFLIVAGAVRLLLAYRNNQPDEFSGAGKDIIIGAAFIAFKLLFWNNLQKYI